MIAFVTIGAFLLSGSASLAVKLVVALLVENAVIVFLLKGEPLAILDVVALFNACLEGGDGERVDKVSLALECSVTFSGGTPDAKRKQSNTQ